MHAKAHGYLSITLVNVAYKYTQLPYTKGGKSSKESHTKQHQTLFQCTEHISELTLSFPRNILGSLHPSSPSRICSKLGS